MNISAIHGNARVGGAKLKCRDRVNIEEVPFQVDSYTFLKFPEEKREEPGRSQMVSSSGGTANFNLISCIIW